MTGIRKLIVLLIAVPSALVAQPTWTKYTGSYGALSYNGYLTLQYDSVNHKGLLYGLDHAGPIYSNSLWTFNAATPAIATLGTSGSSGNDAVSCATSDLTTWPGDRHPVGQFFWDSIRGRAWLFEGVCNTVVRPTYMYYYVPGAGWTRTTPAHLPQSSVGAQSMTCTHDTTNDVFFCFGTDTGAQTHDNWVYCDTSVNPTPGTLTSAQSTAGCSVNGADDWSPACVGGQSLSAGACTGTATQPLGVAFPGLQYVASTGQIVLFGGAASNGTTCKVDTWAYAVSTKSWSNLNPTGTVPAYTGSTATQTACQPAFACSSSSKKCWYQYVGTNVSGSTGFVPHLWELDLTGNTWADLGATGGPRFTNTMVYDPSNNALISYGGNVTGTGIAEFWSGAFPSGNSGGVLSGGNIIGGGKVGH